MACTLSDVIVRRLPLGAAGPPARGIVAACGAVMARECGWDAARLAAETERLLEFYRVD
jgi:glycerol-3-phosphate dehydrogenase